MAELRRFVRGFDRRECVLDAVVLILLRVCNVLGGLNRHHQAYARPRTGAASPNRQNSFTPYGENSSFQRQARQTTGAEMAVPNCECEAWSLGRLVTCGVYRGGQKRKASLVLTRNCGRRTQAWTHSARRPHSGDRARLRATVWLSVTSS